MGEDAQFLFQFPHQRGLGRFARLYLATGKLPQARHRPARAALLEEDTTLGIDQRGRDDDH